MLHKTETPKRLRVLATAAAALLSALALCAHGAGAGAGAGGLPYAESPDEHFHPLGKPPSEHTLAVIREARETMAFSDSRDFNEARRGFRAPLLSKQIEAESGGLAWDIARYDWLLEERSWDSLHPSLERQSQLLQITGLFEVIPGIYQVRGLDLANITFVRGNTGWIVFDPLTAAETAAAGLELVNREIERLPVTAVISSHSHADHFGGIRGVVDPERYANGQVEFIVPAAFMREAISENVYAGNAMNRRLFYQYGVLLPASPYGHAGQGLNQNVAAGRLGLLQPTRVVEEPIEAFEVDGIRMIFQNTPGTEAPSEMNTYLPDRKALWMAENVTGTIHNIYTLRGAKVRDALAWSKYISRAMFLYGQEAEVMLASHHWPRWGNERIMEVLADQRDAYAHLNNHVLHLANQGVTINQIHNEYEAPASLGNKWHARGYHGSPQHNSRAVINRYLGYWDANPTTLIPLSPQDSAPLYVKMMGGVRTIMRAAQDLYDGGQYLLAQEILDKLVWAEPENQAAKNLLADVWEQIGYQQENPGLRNSFLAGAYELRSGIPSGNSPDSAGPDMIAALDTGLFLDFIGIRMDSRKAEGLAFKINLITPDNGERYAVELSNATFTNVEGFLHDDPDLAIAINRSDLETIMLAQQTFLGAIDAGTAQAEGDIDILAQIASTLVQFELGFEVVPGTKTATEPEDAEDFEIIDTSVVGRGE